MLSAADWLDGIEREMMKPSAIAMVGMAGRFPAPAMFQSSGETCAMESSPSAPAPMLNYSPPA